MLSTHVLDRANPMSFRITGLPLARFAPLFALPTAELAARGIVRTAVTDDTGFPCRVTLADAARGVRALGTALSRENRAGGPQHAGGSAFSPFRSLRKSRSDARGFWPTRHLRFGDALQSH